MLTKHPNIEVFEQVYETFTTGDMDKLSELIAPDVVWHVPGDNLISGTYTSRDAIFGCFNKILARRGACAERGHADRGSPAPGCRRGDDGPGGAVDPS
jgi:hypothetical protein